MMALAALAAVFAQPVATGGGDRGPRFPTEADCYDRQRGPVFAVAKYMAVCAARQVGKTDGIRKRARRCLAQPGKRVIYATLIRRNCKKFFWWPILEDLDRDGWRVSSAHGTDLILTLDNGAWMQALSCQEMGDLKTIRGDQADEFLIDECQEPNDDVTEALVTKIAPSMLMKRGGTLSMWGTVPEVEPCFFSKRLDDPKWTVFGHSFHPDGTERSAPWSTFENPFIDPEEIRRTNEDAGLGPGHPIYERETMGRRVKDPSKFAYEYLTGRNDYDPTTVNFDEGPQRHSMGLDLGFSDRDAITVHNWRNDDIKRVLRVRFQWHHNHTDVDDLRDIVTLVYAVYRPAYICGDHGGHGAVKVLKTIENRLGIVIQPKPADVMVSVDLVNDDYRTGRLLHPTVDTETGRVLAMLEEPTEKVRKILERHGPWDDERKKRIRRLLLPDDEKAKANLSDEIGKVAISVNPRTKKREINKKGFHSDISESNRYSHHAARHWATRPPKKAEETREERRDRQWAEERRRMEDPWA